MTGSSLMLAEMVLPAVPYVVSQFGLLPGLALWTEQSSLVWRVTGQAAVSIVSLGVSIVSEIITARLLASSESFPLSTPSANLRRLFSAKERSNFLPSIFTASRLLIRLIPTAATALLQWYMPNQHPMLSSQFDDSPSVMLAVTLGTALLSIPFSVMSERLDVQRAASSTDGTTANRFAKEMAQMAVKLRPEHYRNLQDGYRSIIAEEGYATLFKGWPFEVTCALMTAASQYYVAGQHAAFRAGQTSAALAKSA